MVPQMIGVEKDGDTKTQLIVGTMAESLSPLLTTMKLFGLYFKRGTDAGAQSETSRRKWNVHMIYAAVVLILAWVDVLRMFSVFKNILL